ncbi:hypothetical protein IT570_02475 [Candidatus Sumerlaeota bacterium]|nr:hypothetical protein [Candidatus Sumerlaeota bacterium]
MFFISLPISAHWAMNYGVYATLALANWFALSQLLIGITSKNFVAAATGLAIKPLLLVFLLIAAKYMGVEITSFLAALNTFFLALFGYMGFKLVRGRVVIPARMELEG